MFCRTSSPSSTSTRWPRSRSSPAASPPDRGLAGTREAGEPDAEAVAGAGGVRERAVGDRPEVRLAPVQLEGEEAAEQAVIQPVVVGGAGAQKAEVGAAVGQRERLLLGVRRVEDLNAIEPGGAVAVDGGQHVGLVLDVPEGCAQTATPAASWIQAIASATVGRSRAAYPASPGSGTRG